MPDYGAQVFSVALFLFLVIGSAKLTIEQLIALIVLVKRLIATLGSDYCLETGKLTPRRTQKRSTDSTQILELNLSGRVPR